MWSRGSGVRIPSVTRKSTASPCKEEAYSAFLFEIKNLKNISDNHIAAVNLDNLSAIQIINTMLELYEKTLDARNYKPATTRKNICLVKKFLRDAQISELSHINVEKVEQYLCYLRETGRNGKTVENHKSAISGFCKFLQLRHILDDNPVQYIASLNLPDTIPVYLSDRDVKRCLDIADNEGIIIEVTLALHTGLRMSELQNLNWRDIDFEMRQLIVTESKSKRPRTVPLNKKALEALKIQRKLYPRYDWVFPGGQREHRRARWTKNIKRSHQWWSVYALKRLKEKVRTIKKIPRGHTGRGWHIFRHTFATRLAKKGVDIFKIKDWLGHRKVDTTMRYVHLARNYDKDIELIV